MIHNIPNYSWPFKLDEVFNYAYWDNFLSKKECGFLSLLTYFLDDVF